MKTYAIGDIHGAHKALLQVLERSNFDYETDRLISLGDIADTWPEVPECVEELLKIKNLVAIAGNHDLWARDFLMDGDAPDIWLNQGGRATLDAYKRSKFLTNEGHIAFFKNQLPYFVDDKKRLYVHGGYDSRELIEEQDPYDLAWDRYLWRRAQQLELKGMQYEDVNGFLEVFIGHTPTLLIDPSGAPVQRLNVWNLDTGVKAGEKLTMMNVETKEYVQSDRVEGMY